MDAGANDAPAGANRGERGGNERADGREDDGGVERLGRQLVRAAGPDGPEAPRERLSRAIAGPRKRIDVAVLGSRDLREQMRRGAEAVETEPARVTGRGPRTSPRSDPPR